MLLHLKIRNFAIIDEVELAFGPGFTVITGETGAGKSIVVDALVVALGGRANANLVRTGAEAAEVEALFDIHEHPLVRARLEQRELVGDDPDLLLVRRVVGPRARAKVLVNGRLATVATLAEIVRGLVDISGQHEQQSLLVVDGHVDILDAVGDLGDIRQAYREAYEALRASERELATLRAGAEASLRQADFLRYQVEEIERLGLVAGEDVTLEAERARLANAERLAGGAQTAESMLYGEDGSAFDKLGRALLEVESLARIDGELTALVEPLTGARREVQEAARTLQRYAARIEADPDRLGAIEDRLGEVKRLGRKHGGGVDAVLARVAALRAELESVEGTDVRLAELEASIERLGIQALAHASSLRHARIAAAKGLDAAILRELGDMELGSAVFRTELRANGGNHEGSAANLGPEGLDAVEFVWSANRGEDPKPLAKIASGGELSRLMLAVKTVMRQRDLVSLYVFDEVDTGLGGRAADSIGRKIQAVAEDHQAITITHLAPIAARADHHLRVHKREQGERTVSIVERLEPGPRADEIARMIDGASTSEATREAARQMLARRQERLAG
ncbi:MAG: DNA repair protein RecN [Myxococcota bacterium]